MYAGLLGVFSRYRVEQAGIQLQLRTHWQILSLLVVVAEFVVAVVLPPVLLLLFKKWWQ